MVMVMVSSTFVLADGWSMSEEESISLSFGTLENAKLEIFCDRDTQIVASEPPGVKVSGPVIFSFIEGGKAKTLQLDTEVCGADGLTCSDRKDGEVSAYKKTIRGKKQALAWAEKATAFSIKGPTIDLTMQPDKAVFAKFAKACKKWQ